MRSQRGRRTRFLLGGNASPVASEPVNVESESQQATMYVILEALDGPSAGARTNVAVGQTVRVGRDAVNDFVVPQDPTLSRCHFHLHYDGSQCFVQNQSRYGTFLNEQRIDTECSVRDGDELRAGVCRFSVRFAAADDSLRDSTSPEMLAVRDEDHGPRTQNGGAAFGGLPPIDEEEPVAIPNANRRAPAVSYGLPPIEEDEPLSEPGRTGTSTGAPKGHVQQPSPKGATPAAAKADFSHIKLDDRGLRAEPVADLLGRVRLDDEAKPIAASASHAVGIIDALVAKGLPNEALKVLAAALPPQAAVRWAVRCVRETGDLSKGDVAALAAAERWVAEPSEENRRAAQVAAEKLEFGTAASWAAISAFWSGGSMAPPNVPPVPPPPDLMPQAVYGAIALAAVAQGGEKAPQMQQQFLKLGLDAQPKSS